MHLLSFKELIDLNTFEVNENNPHYGQLEAFANWYKGVTLSSDEVCVEVFKKLHQGKVLGFQFLPEHEIIDARSFGAIIGEAPDELYHLVYSPDKQACNSGDEVLPNQYIESINFAKVGGDGNAEAAIEFCKRYLRGQAAHFQLDEANRLSEERAKSARPFI